MKSILQVLTLLSITLNTFSQTQTDSEFSGLINFNKKLYGKFIGVKYPDFNVKIAGAQVLSSKDIKNKVVFINFWAKFCSPCIAETEGLIQLYSKLQNHPDFQFLSFSYDPDSTINDLVKKYKINFKVYHLDKSEFQRLNLNNGIPTSIILDNDGTVKYFVSGGPGNKDQATKYITTYVYQQILNLLTNKSN